MRTSLPVALLSLLAVSCSTTKLQSTWRDPKYEAQPVGRVLVIGFQANQDAFDEPFENGLATLLRARGYQVATAHKVFFARDVDAEKIEKFVRETDTDLVIQERLVGSTSSTYTPPSGTMVSLANNPSYGWYGGYFPVFYQSMPGHVAENTEVIAEVLALSVRTKTVVWSCTGRTSNVIGDADAPRSLAAEVVSELSDAGILKKK